MARPFGKIRLSHDEAQYLKIKMLLANIRYRDIAEKFGVSHGFITQILNGERYRKDIVEYIRAIPESEDLKRLIKFRKSQHAA